MSTQKTLERLTQFWVLENLQVHQTAGEVRIICGGTQMPRYIVTKPTIEAAITELVLIVTNDAVADELIQQACPQWP